MNDLTVAIGSGGIFPIELKEGAWKIVSGDPELIRNNLISILNYQVGTRFRQEEFGSRSWECIEEPNTQVTQFLVYRFTKSAIESWEPRIKLLESSITSTSDSINIYLKYQIIDTQQVSDLDFSYQKY